MPGKMCEEDEEMITMKSEERLKYSNLQWSCPQKQCRDKRKRGTGPFGNEASCATNTRTSIGVDLEQHAIRNGDDGDEASCALSTRISMSI
jgi:hypothetical protein